MWRRPPVNSQAEWDSHENPWQLLPLCLLLQCPEKGLRLIHANPVNGLILTWQANCCWQFLGVHFLEMDSVQEKSDSCCQGINLTHKQVAKCQRGTWKCFPLGSSRTACLLPPTLKRSNIFAVDRVFHLFLIKAYSYTFGPQHCIHIRSFSFDMQNKQRVCFPFWIYKHKRVQDIKCSASHNKGLKQDP